MDEKYTIVDANMQKTQIFTSNVLNSCKRINFGKIQFMLCSIFFVSLYNFFSFCRIWDVAVSECMGLKISMIQAMISSALKDPRNKWVSY